MSKPLPIVKIDNKINIYKETLVISFNIFLLMDKNEASDYVHRVNEHQQYSIRRSLDD